MSVYLISDDEATSVKVRKVLLLEALDCPTSHVVTLDLAPARIARDRPDLIVVVLNPDVEKALAVLPRVRPDAPTRVLVVGPASDPRMLIRALRSGADDYIDQDHLENHLREALTRCRGAVQAHEETGRLIAVLAPSGGSGSSTLAANIATALAKEHKQTALLDLKLDAGDLAALLDLKPSHTLADLCQNIARMDRALFEGSLTKHASGVHLLASPRRLADVAYVTPEGIRQVLTLARAAFPYVIVDVDHSYREEPAQVLRQADIILLVMRLEFAALRNARRTLDHLQDLGVPEDRVRLVVNRYGQAREVPASRAEGALGAKIFHYIPEDSKTVNRANNNGVPLVLESPSAKVSKSVFKLAASVNGRHKAH